jgi:hypothetical protein
MRGRASGWMMSRRIEIPLKPNEGLSGAPAHLGLKTWSVRQVGAGRPHDSRRDAGATWGGIDS